MKILYLGDVMGRPGRAVVAALLPGLKKRLHVDVVVAQSENVSHGKAMTPGHMHDLQAAGVDMFSGGNHSVERKATRGLLADPQQPVTAPVNQIGAEVEWGSKVLMTAEGSVLLVSLLGTIYPPVVEVHNPLQVIDDVLAYHALTDHAAIIVNFHGDMSSEKRMAGYYLDGRVSAVIGDHWHVPTADAMILPKGTAHISDVGMCGTLHSSLGVDKDIAISRWRDGAKLRNAIAEGGPFQLNGLLVTVDPKTHLASKVQPINEVVEKLG